MKILIADDDPEIVRMLSIYLRAAGLTPIVARDAMQAFMFAKQHAPAAILLDLEMPGGSGVEALRHLKRSQLTRAIPVIVISGTADAQLRGTAQELGASAFHPKPLDLDKLMESIRQHVELSATSPGGSAVRERRRALVESMPEPSVLQDRRILIAEDDEIHRRTLTKFLTQWGYEVVCAQDGREAAQALSVENPPRIALLDWIMPGMDGLAICRKVRERNVPYTFLILLTVKDQKSDVLQGLDAGADDYLTKPFDARELRARLKTASRIIGLHKQLEDAHKELLHNATHDALTAIPNRRRILDILDREREAARLRNLPMAVILADLDRFKQLNDTHGHLAGDAALREAAMRISSAIRKGDAVGRYGGEEFLIVAQGCGSREAEALAERIRVAVSQEPIQLPEAAHEETARLTISLGVSVLTPDSTVPTVQLLASADSALYRAKGEGRNRAVTTLPRGMAEVQSLRDAG